MIQFPRERNGEVYDIRILLAHLYYSLILYLQCLNIYTYALQTAVLLRGCYISRGGVCVVKGEYAQLLR